MNDELILVQNLIHEIRGKKVMLDFDLARLYHIETKVLKQAVRRNLERFPDDFMFTLSSDEYNSLKVSIRSQFVTLEDGRGKYPKYPPFAFTEQGVAMQREEDLGALNDLSEDVRQDIDNLYLAIADLSSKIEEKKNEPRPRIGFK